MNSLNQEHELWHSVCAMATEMREAKLVVKSMIQPKFICLTKLGHHVSVYVCYCGWRTIGVCIVCSHVVHFVIRSSYAGDCNETACD